MFVQINWDTPKDVEKYKKQVEKERIYDFLAGLIPELDEVKVRLLGIKPPPAIDEIFAEVRREANRKRVMLEDSEQPSIENSALATRGQESSSGPKKNTPWCEHCKRANHSISMLGLTWSIDEQEARDPF